MDGIEEFFNGKSLTIDLLPKGLEWINKVYLQQYSVYERVSNEVKPDLFFCQVSYNALCYDMAWKFNKPVVSLAIMLVG
jgi:hypothetical protein